MIDIRIEDATPKPPGLHLLEVRDLVVEFRVRAGVAQVIKGFSFHLDPGETLAVLAESGSGKSVTAQAVMGILDMPPARIASGEILFDGDDLLTMPDHLRRTIRGHELAMIFRDAWSTLNPVFPVGWQISESLRGGAGMSKADAMRRAIELMDLVKIPSATARVKDYPHQFSGGMRQRLMIAMALATDPKALIADEPAAALDVTVQAQIIDLLADLRRDLGMGLILMTRDEGVAAVADRIVGHGDARGIHKRRATATPVRAGSQERSPAEPILRVENLVKHFPITRGILFKRQIGALRAVDGVGFELRRGEILGIVGESGCGKSTLARLLMRAERPDAGRVLLNGRDIFAMDGAELRHLRRNVQMVLPDPATSLNPRWTIGDIVGEPFAIHADVAPRGDRKRRVRELLELVGLDPEHIHRYPHQFSDGQRQRIGIGRALALKPEVIICDESLSALDILRTLRDELRLSCIFMAHNLSEVRHIADRVGVMYLGKLVEIGTEDEIYRHATHPYTQALLSSVLVPDPEARAHREVIRLDGDVPSPSNPPSGCRFRAQCWKAQDRCADEEPLLIRRAVQPHPSACHYAEVRHVGA